MTITFRPIQLSDGEKIFAWRNDPATRKYFFHPEPLDLQEHLQWLQASCADENRHLLMASSDGEEIGVMRLDCNDDQAEVTLYLDPTRHARGLGVQMIEAIKVWVRQQLPQINNLYARILLDNIASQKAFMKSGFSAHHQVFYYEITTTRS